MSVMYHITAEPERLGCMTEEDFYDHIDALGADYVQDQDPEDAKYALDALRRRLDDAGFATSDPDPEDGYDDEAFRFTTGGQDALDACKDGWFKDIFKELRSKVAAMTLAQFSRDTGPAYGLTELVNDRFGDHAYLDMGTGPATYTVPSFIRNLEPGRTYYVSSNTVYLH